MKCPLIMIGVQAWSVSPSQHEGDCLGEECAWWESDRAQCAVLGVFPRTRGVGSTAPAAAEKKLDSSEVL